MFVKKAQFKYLFGWRLSNRVITIGNSRVQRLVRTKCITQCKSKYLEYLKGILQGKQKELQLIRHKEEN